MCMMLASGICAVAQQDSNFTDSVSEPLSEGNWLYACCMAEGTLRYELWTVEPCGYCRGLGADGHGVVPCWCSEWRPRLCQWDCW